jgi:alpha-glucosidase
LSNHDLSRHASRYAIGRASGLGTEATEARARVAAVMLATLPGTTFLYYGEEIGMTDVAVPAAQATDPNGRDPARTPMQWDLNLAGAGFTRGTPWRPVPRAGVDVVSQLSDPDSLLRLYRRLLRLRHDHPALTSDAYQELAAGQDVYAYRRGDADRAVVIVLNFADGPRRASIELAGHRGTGRVIVDSHRQTAATTSVDLGRVDLLANQAIVVELDGLAT